MISDGVWLDFRVCLSDRDVEALMAERGISLTSEAVRDWCRTFGQTYANQPRRRRPRPDDQWHLDEVFLIIQGQLQRDKKAATRCFPTRLKGFTEVPGVVTMDTLKSYGATLREMLPHVEHRQHRSLHNRAENAHQPTRPRERRMGRFKSPGHAPRLLSADGPITSHVRPRRHLCSAPRIAKRRPNNSRSGGRSRARPRLRQEQA
jgi:putative transposase